MYFARSSDKNTVSTSSSLYQSKVIMVSRGRNLFLVITWLWLSPGIFTCTTNPDRYFNTIHSSMILLKYVWPTSNSQINTYKTASDIPIIARDIHVGDPLHTLQLYHIHIEESSASVGEHMKQLLPLAQFVGEGRWSLCVVWWKVRDTICMLHVSCSSFMQGGALLWSLIYHTQI